MGKVFDIDIQMRFADADILGHVNNVTLIHYFDLGKTEFYAQVMGRKVEPSREGSILVSVHTDYMEQTRLGDKLYVETAVEKIGTKSVTFFQKLINRRTGALHATCRSVAVGFDFTKQESMELKPEWKAKLREYLMDCDMTDSRN
jgi:acyl-CoA thioester hydrolase